MPLNNDRIIIKSKLTPLNVELETSSFMIFVVGPNGSGKSRLLESIQSGEADIQYLFRIPNYDIFGLET